MEVKESWEENKNKYQVLTAEEDNVEHRQNHDVPLKTANEASDHIHGPSGSEHRDTPAATCIL